MNWSNAHARAIAALAPAEKPTLIALCYANAAARNELSLVFC